MRETTHIVAMLADVPQCDCRCLPMCDWALMTWGVPHSIWMYLTLIGQQKYNGATLDSVVDYELRCQFIDYNDIM